MTPTPPPEPAQVPEEKPSRRYIEHSDVFTDDEAHFIYQRKCDTNVHTFTWRNVVDRLAGEVERLREEMRRARDGVEQLKDGMGKGKPAALPCESELHAAALTLADDLLLVRSGLAQSQDFALLYEDHIQRYRELRAPVAQVEERAASIGTAEGSSPSGGANDKLRAPRQERAGEKEGGSA